MSGAKVNQDVCIGCGLCVQMCPQAFEMLNDGKAKAINPTDASKDMIDQAIATCPNRAIGWEK